MCVVLTCPPLAMSKIEMRPPLPPNRLHAMRTCQTWMGDVLKFAVVFEEKFWESAGLSGYGNSRDVTTWDASDCQTFAIAGFAKPAGKDETEEEVEERLKSALCGMFGSKAEAGV